ncbi:MAG: hypothetical protein JWP22_1332, partial [Ramlibacter sp.]|nr:hypothetical protein [Ramlibacter sp.]
QKFLFESAMAGAKCGGDAARAPQEVHA